MTPFNVCPACVRLNLPDASICTTCGAWLPPGTEEHSETFVNLTEMELDTDTTPSVHLDAPELQRWFNSRTGGLDGHSEPTHPTHPAEKPEHDSPPPPLTLREFEAPSAASNDEAATADPRPAGLTQSDPQSAAPYLSPEAPAATAAPSPHRSAIPLAPGSTPPVVKAATKALRRAEVRRSLQANKLQPEAAAAPADVLVLESEDAAREQLCALLEAFGFRTHPVQSTMQAVRMLAAKRYAVAFLNIIFDGSAAPASQDLCGRVKAPPTHANDTVCVLIVVTGAARPLERVRAELAGCDAFLRKPVSRGAVAQALEGCGVALPIDARRV